ncbi:MAG: FHA domain-containing protein [Deltaproteobacteria bacterium]|nr:MAG: FHA domain-containing protein [Deltaproteobacteria bacterium]
MGIREKIRMGVEDFLARTDVFMNVNLDTRIKIAQKLRTAHFPAGTTIFSPRERVEHLYIIRNGSVEISGEDRETGLGYVVALLKRYNIFGETALLTDGEQPFRAYALSDTDCYTLSPKIFQQILLKIPETGVGLSKSLIIQLERVYFERAIPFSSLAHTEHDLQLIQIFPIQLIKRFRFFPIERKGSHLVLAMTNPRDRVAIEQIRKYLPDQPFCAIAVSEREWQSFFDTYVAPSLPKMRSGEKSSPLYQIVVEHPDGKIERFPFGIGKMTIGSASENEIVLRGKTIAPRHARLRHAENRFTIRDLGSKSGVFVNGFRIDPQVDLELDDTVTIGEYKLHLERCGAEGEAAEGEDHTQEVYAESNLPEDDSPMGRIIRSFLYPIAEYLYDPTVSEIMVNSWEEIYIERRGRLVRTDKKFDDPSFLDMALNNIAQFVGRRIDAENPRLDARLPDGSRVHAVIPPCARQGTTITIRKFTKERLTIDRLIELGTLNEAARTFLEFAVRVRKNIVVSGGSGTGKTSMLNALSAFIPADQRIIVLEDASELQLQQEHKVLLETRPPDKHGRGEVTMRDLLHSSLRMRPDRIIVGEVRGGEALDMLQAMNTGHLGSMTTVHSNAPRDTLARIETMCLMAGVELSLSAIREQVASAIHLIVHLERLADGSRKVVNITEILGIDSHANILMQDIFTLRVIGTNKAGHPIFDLRTTGNVPAFYTYALKLGLASPLPKDFFKER